MAGVGLSDGYQSPIWRRVIRSGLVDYRVPVSATIMVAALASMFVLTSQSASSLPTYLLAVYVLAGARGWRSLLFDPGLLLVVAVLVYIPATSLWSTPWDTRGAFSQAMRALLVFTFVVSVAECLQVDWFRRRMTLVLAVFGGVAAATAIAVFYLESPADGRLNGLGQIDTHVTAALVYAVALVCALAWLATPGESRGPAVRLVVYGCVAVLAVAVVLAGSRSAVVCILCGAGCLWLAYRVASVGRFVLLGAAAAIAFGSLLAAAYFLVPGADLAILPRGDSFRGAIWTEYAGRIAANGPWFGLGVLTPDETMVAGYPVLHPHNLFLAVTYQGGLVGFALMVAVIALTLRTLLGHYREDEAKLGLAIWAIALPAYLLDGHELVDKIGWTWLLFWLPVAIGLGVRGRVGLEDARRFGARLD